LKVKFALNEKPLDKTKPHQNANSFFYLLLGLNADSGYRVVTSYSKVIFHKGNNWNKVNWFLENYHVLLLWKSNSYPPCSEVYLTFQLLQPFGPLSFLNWYSIGCNFTLFFRSIGFFYKFGCFSVVGKWKKLRSCKMFLEKWK